MTRGRASSVEYAVILASHGADARACEPFVYSYIKASARTDDVQVGRIR